MAGSGTNWSSSLGEKSVTFTPHLASSIVCYFFLTSLCARPFHFRGVVLNGVQKPGISHLTNSDPLSVKYRSPDEAKIKQKMLFASSKDALRRSLQAVAVEIQGTDFDEISYESGTSLPFNIALYCRY